MADIRCIIVEDEDPAMEELVHLLSEYPNVCILGTARNGNDGMALYLRHHPNVVFLDINMPGKNGLELASQIRNIHAGTAIVFITAYEEHALEAFEIDVTDYVLKPFCPERLAKTVNKLARQQSADSVLAEIQSCLKSISTVPSCKKIPCEHKGKTILIDVGTVCYCCTDGDKTLVHTADAAYLTHFTLQQLEAKTGFFRTHRSFLVNTDSIREFYPWVNGSYEIVMNDSAGSIIPLSRYNVRKLKELFDL